MDNREQYLTYILEKLDAKLLELRSSLEDGMKEIESMHEYYWDNYTEMDQYGYEEYDNRQALLHQVNANQEKRNLLHRYEKMKDSPYFGRVDFRFDEEEEPESFYIGIGNFSEKTGMTPLIYDWRAPVSSLFYDYDQGEAYYEAPMGEIHGTITSKWQYKIRGGKMKYAFESDMKIDDEVLKHELGHTGDIKLKNIIRTIQKEQNSIIRNTKDKIMVVQGSAGSGKTSIALHRIAYLLYHDRKNLKSSNILILSPNSVFADYISHILPELGEEHIQEMSYDLFAYHELKQIVEDCEDRYQYLERQLKGMDLNSEELAQHKQSSAFIGELEGFLAMLEDGIIEFKDVELGGLVRTEQDLIDLFYFKFQEHPLLVRLDVIKEHFIDEYETLYDRNISDELREKMNAIFDSMYLTKDIYKIYNWFLKDNQYEELPDVEKERRILPYEDVYPLLYLKYRLCGAEKQKRIKHLVIDEMQDYSYLQYQILRNLFSCKMTILGDRLQTMDHETQDVMRFLPKILGKEIRLIALNKSYRNTLEIAQYAADLVGDQTTEFFERHGMPVAELEFEQFAACAEYILGKLKALDDQYDTAAIITYTEAEAKSIYEYLLTKEIAVDYLDKNSSKFKKGLTVTTFYMAKGLEFDQVFVVRKKKENDLYRQADYIGATRAMHELHMIDLKGEILC